MPETYEEAVESKQEETEDSEEHKEGMPNYAGSFPGPRDRVDTVSEEALDKVGGVELTPDFLRPRRTIDRPDEGPGGGGGGIGRQPIELPDLGEIIDVDIPETPEVPDIEIPEGEEIPDDQLQQLQNLQVLQTIAQQAAPQVQLLQTLAQLQVSQLSTMIDIRQNVRPYQNITVSGTNIIEDADSPEPVVPQSDETDIPTRLLFIRADPRNTEPIALGDDEVQPELGYLLDNGRVLTLEMDLRGITLWMSSEEPGQRVQLLGMV